ncbi:tripartite tricarboxylate transporter TctB family protein [Pelagibius sp.]|uniref:tripartite tricarboxylate transporter TctB family protein n=1 Tax=Pelagibius sp. TaxID=1931238 RepID=UPI003BAB7978
MRPHSDLWIGAVLAGIGLWAFWEASGFDARSSTYPMIVAGLLAASGAGIAGMSLVRGAPPVALAAPLRAALPAGGIIAAWAAALGFGLGFLLPTLLMQIGLLWLSGMRGVLRILGTALLITVAAYALFVAGLEVPLPRSRVPGLI